MSVIIFVMLAGASCFDESFSYITCPVAASISIADGVSISGPLVTVSASLAAMSDFFNPVNWTASMISVTAEAFTAFVLPVVPTASVEFTSFVTTTASTAFTSFVTLTASTTPAASAALIVLPVQKTDPMTVVKTIITTAIRPVILYMPLYFIQATS